MRCHRILFAGLFSLGLAACSYVPPLVTEYRIDIQQGNVINRDMVAQLKPGLTREQVKFLLGTPMLTDMFHEGRWDYLYRYQNGATQAVDTQRISIYFDADGRLQRVTGDVLPQAVPDAMAPATRNQVLELGALPADAKGQPLPPVEERGLIGGVLEKIGF